MDVHMRKQLYSDVALGVVEVDLAVLNLGVDRVLEGLLFAFEIFYQFYLHSIF